MIDWVVTLAPMLPDADASTALISTVIIAGFAVPAGYSHVNEHFVTLTAFEVNLDEPEAIRPSLPPTSKQEKEVIFPY